MLCVIEKTAFSFTCMSDTIIDDSRTFPQCVHTASAREGSTSMSVEPQESHFKPFLLLLPLTVADLTLGSG